MIGLIRRLVLNSFSGRPNSQGARSDCSRFPLSTRQVITEQQGQELADELGLRFLETSAKTNINVEEAFFALARCGFPLNSSEIQN